MKTENMYIYVRFVLKFKNKQTHDVEILLDDLTPFRAKIQDYIII